MYEVASLRLAIVAKSRFSDHDVEVALGGVQTCDEQQGVAGQEGDERPVSRKMISAKAG